MSTHGDGGKGSGRRKEDASKVRDNWDLIFGSATKNKKEKSKMDTWNHFDDEHIEQEDEDGEYDDTCTRCGGCGEGSYDGASCQNCHGTGVEPFERIDDDYE